MQETGGLRVFTFGREIEHVVTAEWWERPEGVCNVQQRGTALTQGFSVSQGSKHNTVLSKRFFLIQMVSESTSAVLSDQLEHFILPLTTGVCSAYTHDTDPGRNVCC